MLSSGVLSNPRPEHIVFVHFGDNGPKGTGSTYQDWRDAALHELDLNGLKCVVKNEDQVIAHDGMTISV